MIVGDEFSERKAFRDILIEHQQRGFQRDAELYPLQYAGRLLQEMIIDAWICVESNRLNFQWTNQKQLRADLYSGLQDAVGGGLEENAQRLGRQIILSSSFIGSPRHM